MKPREKLRDELGRMFFTWGSGDSRRGKCPCGAESIGYWCIENDIAHEHFFVCRQCKDRVGEMGPLMSITIGGDWGDR
jgi:hypothetical protein